MNELGGFGPSFIMNWQPIKGYEGKYSISDTGMVWSEERIAISGNGARLPCGGHEKKPTIHPKGYIQVCLRKNGKNNGHKIHRLVAEAFIPNPDDLIEVNHINGDKSDNRVENLEWSDRSHNMKHAYHEIGAYERKGEKNANSRIDEDGVREIRRLREEGATIDLLVSSFNISKTQVRRILKRESWSHVD